MRRKINVTTGMGVTGSSHTTTFHERSVSTRSSVTVDVPVDRWCCTELTSLVSQFCVPMASPRAFAPRPQSTSTRSCL